MAGWPKLGRLGSDVYGSIIGSISGTPKQSSRVLKARASEEQVGHVQVEDRIEFTSSVFFCQEGDGHITVDIARLGRAAGLASVEYFTQDGSARAGRKYVATNGVLEFHAGERRKRIHVGILDDEEFDTTLEFQVCLVNSTGAQLGEYLRQCQIVIMDNDSFPTNKYRTLLRAGLASEIPYWPLLSEYFYMHLQESGFRRACVITLLSDQVANVRFVMAVLLTNYLVDELLRPPEGSQPPENVHNHILVLTGLSLVPHFLVWFLDRRKAYRRINGMAIGKLQQNLLRKYLNYGASARNSVSISDLTMAITRDVPEVVENGFSSVFGVLQNFGLLVVCVALQINKIGTAMWFTALLFIGYPLVTICFLAIRQKGGAKRRDLHFRRQTEVVGFIQQVTECYQLINDYQQRPPMVKIFNDRVCACNAACLQANVWDITNQHFTPFLGTLMCALSVLFSYQKVLDGGPIGEFLTGVAIWKGIGTCYKAIFDKVGELQNVVSPLHNIVFFMNLPCDIGERMRYNRWQLDNYKQGIDVAQAQLLGLEAEYSPYVCSGMRVAAGDLSEEPFDATDLLQIHCKNIAFAYPKCTGGGTRVLEGCCFDLPQGKLIAVSGPRGGGKATLLKLLGNVTLPLDESSSSSGDFFLPPHLRVLHVSYEPKTIDDLDVFANLCFGPNALSDQLPKRVLAICRRLGMSHELKQLVEDHANACDRQRIGQDGGNGFGAWGRQASSIGGTSWQLSKHRGEKVIDGKLLAHTDLCLIHLARAFVMNPDVLILHKPLAQLDELHARFVLELLREFVDLRGIEKPPEERKKRRPRTCIFSVADFKYSDVADMVLHVNQGKVSRVDVDQLVNLRKYARKLFDSMDLNCDSLVNRKEFLAAVEGAPWASELLGVSAGQMDTAVLGSAFDLLDRNNNGEVDFDELVHHLQRRFDAGLPQLLNALQSQCGSPTSMNVDRDAFFRELSPPSSSEMQTNTRWKVPEVATEVPMPLARKPMGGHRPSTPTTTN